MSQSRATPKFYKRYPKFYKKSYITLNKHLATIECFLNAIIYYWVFIKCHFMICGRPFTTHTIKFGRCTCHYYHHRPTYREDQIYKIRSFKYKKNQIYGTTILQNNYLLKFNLTKHFYYIYYFNKKHLSL